MKIRTEETSQYYESWEYTVDSLPEDFADWNPEDQFNWLQRNANDARKLHSEPSDMGFLDEYKIVTEEA